MPGTEMIDSTGMIAGTEIIDSHLHFWNPERIDYFWLGPSTPTLCRTVDLDELEPQRLAAGVTRGVFVQASHDPRELGWVLRELERFPWVRGVVGWLDLTAQNLEIQARAALKDARFKGVRHLTHDVPDAHWLARSDVGAGLNVLETLGLSFDLVLRPEQLSLAAEVMGQHPGLNVVLDHLGNPPLRSGDLNTWARDLTALAALPNLTAKVSGLLTGLETGQDHTPLREAVHLAFGVFGARRLMYGGDWPMATLAASYQNTLETLRALLPPLLPGEEQAFWAGTASRVYRLSSPMSMKNSLMENNFMENSFMENSFVENSAERFVSGVRA